MVDVREASKPKAENGPTQIQPKETAARPAVAPGKGNGSPFAFVRRFAEEMDRMFEDFGVEFGVHLPRTLTRGHELLRREVGMVPADWSPRVDILEREGQFVVRADLPGLSKDDVKVEISEGVLTIQGERTHEKKEERKGYYYNECSYGNFYRSIPLPEGVETAKATADFRQGVLEVVIPAPARQEKKSRRLEIRESK